MTKRFLTFLLLGCLMMNLVPVAFAAETSENPYAGKIISIMGDSISTFTGQPHSEKNRYPENAQGSGVDTVEDTWWMQLINDLDATLGICEARGSSTVTNIYDNLVQSGRKGPTTAMASWDRINDLDENGTPDVILLYGGTNDINAVYRDKYYTMGEFDPATAPSLEDYDPAKDTAIKWNNVVEGYVAAILRMKATYPDAELIAILPINDKNGFNATIQKIYDHYDVPTVSLEHITSAGLWDTLHPNAYGMDLITEAVKSVMLDLVKKDVPKGDVSGDGKIGIADYTILVRYLAGWENYEEKIVAMEAADVNADGIVGIADATIFARYLAGWNGYDQYFE